MTRTPVCFHASSGALVGGGGLGVDDSAIFGNRNEMSECTEGLGTIEHGRGEEEVEAQSEFGWRAGG